MLNMVKSYSFKIILLFVSLLFVHSCSTEPESGIDPGQGVFMFDDYAPLSEKPVRVFTYRPEGDITKMPILFVLHGTLRNADDYRDNWMEIADEHEVLIVTPEFSEEHFPGSRGYNLGGMFDEDGDPVDEEFWAYSLIEPIFDKVVDLANSEQTSYDIFGHSAGAQFAHRLFLFKEDLRTNHVISANAGWYTLPDFEIDFPHGLRNTALDQERLNRRLSSRLLLQLGEEDTDPEDRYLRTSDEAMEQGEHRFERGHYFRTAAEEIADEEGVELQWDIRVVPGVGHDNAEMAKDIAEYLFGN